MGSRVRFRMRRRRAMRPGRLLGPRLAAGIWAAALIAAAGVGGWMLYGDRLPAAEHAVLTSADPPKAKVRLP
jgi:hypothetical protein